MNKLKRHRDLLSDEKLTAAIVELQDLRQSMEDKLDELSRKLQGLHLEDEENGALRHREQVDRQRQLVLSKLDAPSFQHEFEKASRERQNTPSGNWILGHRTYKEWTDMKKTEHKTLYLNGSPGTGG